MTLHDARNSFDDDDYYQLVMQYIKSKHNGDIKGIFNDDYPYHLSVIFDNDDNLTKIDRGLNQYFKLESYTYIIDKGNTDIWDRQEEKGWNNLGIIGTYQTKAKHLLTYGSYYDRILIMPLKNVEPLQALHITAIHQKSMDKNRHSYPSIYVSEHNRHLYLYRGEEDGFTKEDLFELLDIKPVEHIFLDKFSLRNDLDLWLQYEDDMAVVSLYKLHTRDNDLWGSVYIFYPHKRPIKSTTFSKETLFYLEKYFDTKQLSSKIQLKRSIVDLGYINITNPYWLAILGKLLESRGEEVIPKCFNLESIRKEYQEFQTFETLYQIKEGR